MVGPGQQQGDLRSTITFWQAPSISTTRPSLPGLQKARLVHVSNAWASLRSPGNYGPYASTQPFIIHHSSLPPTTSLAYSLYPFAIPTQPTHTLNLSTEQPNPRTPLPNPVRDPSPVRHVLRVSDSLSGSFSLCARPPIPPFAGTLDLRAQ